MLAAIVRGNPAEVRSYIKSGLDPNAADATRNGNTPLMVACAPTQKLPALEVLLTVPHLDKDAVNNQGMTALHQAAWYGQQEAVAMLLRAGAGHEIRTPAGLTAGDIAKNMGHAGTLALLDEEAARRAHSPIETTEELRARIKAQYCRARETAARRRQPQLAEPRPLLAPQSTTEIRGAPSRPSPAERSRPECGAVLVAPAPRAAEEFTASKGVRAADPLHRDCGGDGEPIANAEATPWIRAHEEQGLPRKACQRGPTSEGKPTRWMVSGASTARARVGKDDAILLLSSETGSPRSSPITTRACSATTSAGSIAGGADTGKERIGGVGEDPNQSSESTSTYEHAAVKRAAALSQPASSGPQAGCSSTGQSAFFITEVAETPR
jgi:hypothetical protein